MKDYIYKIGYLKDYLASFLFVITFIILYFSKDLNKIKNILILGIFICFLVDFTFSLNPHYHFETIGYNIPSTIILSGIIFLIIILFVNRRKLFFNFSNC